MSRNGSGVYTLPPGINPVTQDTTITSNWANTTLADIAAALTQSLARDGQTVPVANLPMGGFRHTGVGNPTARNQYASLGWVQDGYHIRLTSVGGTNDVSGQLIGNPTSLQTGQLIQVTPTANNTGNVTLNINSIGAKPVVKPDGSQFASGQWRAGYPYMVIYDGTKFIAVNVNGADWNTNLSNIPANIVSWADIAPDTKLDDKVDVITDWNISGAGVNFNRSSSESDNGPGNSHYLGYRLSNDGNSYVQMAMRVGGPSTGQELWWRHGNSSGDADWTQVWHSGNFNPNDKANTAHTHAAGDITSGTFANARISQGNVTQHQGALSIRYNQLTGTPSIPTSSDYVATSGDQSGLSGNKTWTGAHSFSAVDSSNFVAAADRGIRIAGSATANYLQSGEDGSGWKELRFGPYSSSSWHVRITDSGDVEANGTISDTNGNVRKLPARSGNSNLTLAAGDLNGVVEKTSAGGTYNYTIPSGLGTRGDAITIVNSTTGSINIVRGSGVGLYRHGTNADIEIGPFSMVTIYKAQASDRWIA